MIWFNRLQLVEKLALLSLLIYSFVPTFAGLLRIIQLVLGLDVFPNPRANEMPGPIVLHILSSFMFCIFGAVQFLPTVRRTQPRFHRALGRWVAASGVLSAVTGLYMTVVFSFPESLQGDTLYFARLIVGFAMVTLLIRGILRARAAKLMGHRADVLRAYALGQGASTQVFTGLFGPMVTGEEPQGSLRDGLMISSWGINLVLAQVLIWKPAKRSANLPKTSRNSYWLCSYTPKPRTISEPEFVSGLSLKQCLPCRPFLHHPDK